MQQIRTILPNKDIFAKMSGSKNKEEFLIPTVREVQQMFAELLSHGDDITWDLLSANQGKILKSKVNELNEVSSERTPRHPFMFSSIWGQRKFTNGQSLTAPFFVMIVDNVTNPKLAEQSRSWYLYPVFRCRRCVEGNTGQNNSSLECCMTYVSHIDCIESWDTFVRDTRLRPGIMVTPYRGVYKLIDGKVELKTYLIRKGMYGQDRFISQETLTAAELTSNNFIEVENCLEGFSERYSTNTTSEVSLRDRILYQLLILRGAQKSTDATELSDSLTLFTHSVNNFRLASSMIRDQTYRTILSNRLKSVFDKISEETKRIEGTVDLIRSVNEVPAGIELDNFFKTRRLRKKPMINEVHTGVPVDLLQITNVYVKGEEVKLEDYGTALKQYIICPESFEDLITNMAEHFEPEMFKVIMELTQTFIEKTREELWQLLKYHFSTETVLYQTILCIIKHHSNLDYNEVKNQSSDILSRVRYYFASASPNYFPELLKKCPKCVGYYHIK